MKQNNNDQGASLRRAAPRPTEPKPSIQQPNNTNEQYNPYADWTFEQLYSECKRRGLL